jgi:RNA ligase (TIGR02306 family)
METVSSERQLATIRSAREIRPIPGADAIQAVVIDGWVCVSKKDEFKVGDKGVYFEIDSFLPGSDPRFAFLSKQFITFNNVSGARLRTIRLRGQLSQGLFLPLTVFPELEGKDVGDDVTRELNIVKWEPATVVAEALKAKLSDPFPAFITKTDQPRIQNLMRDLQQNAGKEFEVTIKLDGSSMTVYRKDDKKGVCSRNCELKEEDGGNYWKVATQSRLLEALDFLKRNLAFQGELMGESVQGNNEKLKGIDFYMFDIYDIDNQKYLSPIERKNILKTLDENGFKIKHVPTLDNLVLNHTMEELLALADGFSLNPTQKREGLVFKRMDGLYSFKSISNAYLEKHKDR